MLICHCHFHAGENGSACVQKSALGIIFTLNSRGFKIAFLFALSAVAEVIGFAVRRLETAGKQSSLDLTGMAAIGRVPPNAGWSANDGQSSAKQITQASPLNGNGMPVDVGLY